MADVADTPQTRINCLMMGKDEFGNIVPISLTSTGAMALPSIELGLNVGTTEITSGTTGSILYDDGGVLGELAQIPVSKGGTGASTLTAHGVMIGNGTSTVAVTSAGTATQVLTSNGASADPTFQALPASTLINGSTTIASGTSGRILYDNAGVLGEYSAAAATAYLDVMAGDAGAGGAKGLVPAQVAGDLLKYLKGDGSFSLVDLLTGVTGTLVQGNGGTGFAAGYSAGQVLVGDASGGLLRNVMSGDATIASTGVLTLATVGVAKGGTGATSLTAYAPLFGGTTGTGAVQSGTVGSAGQLLTSNGAGALPTFQDPDPQSIIIASTPVTGGTDGRILYESAGVVNQKAVTGTGDVVLADSPTITTALTSAGTNTLGTIVNGTAFSSTGTFTWGASSVSVFVQDSTPTALALDDLWYETDTGIWWFWGSTDSGNKWLSEQLFMHTGAYFAGVTVNSLYRFNIENDSTAQHDLYLVDLCDATYPNATNNGSNYWTGSVVSMVADTTETTRGSFNTSADTANVYTTHKASLNLFIDLSATLIKAWMFRVTKTNSPGYIISTPTLTYRWVHL